jgi:hypothetical protein
MKRFKYTCPNCGKPLTKNGPNGSGSKPRWVCRSPSGDRTYCYSTTNPASKHKRTQSGKNEKPAARAQKFTRPLGGITRVLVTAAQNATPIHEGFVKALETARRYYGEASTEIAAIPLRYKNPTSRWSESQANEERWAPEIAPYLFNQRRRLNKNLVLLGDVKTQPTAESPLQGFETITHGESGIFGHTKLQLKVVPTPQHKLPKILTTTGACTVPNYTDSKAGKKGEFHHVLGAVIVELVGDKFHLRQINAKADGSFIDLDREFHPDGRVTKPGATLGIAFGDKHVRFVDPKVERATFGKGGIVEVLNPAVLVYHDLLDGYAINPHHRRNADPFSEQAKFRANMQDVRDEVFEALQFIQERAGSRHSVIVPSNHNDFLRRWLVDVDWRKDPRNAAFYLETALAMVSAAEMTKHGATYPDPFVLWAERYFGSRGLRVTCIGKDESFTLGDIECGYHGDHGPNGARGTMSNLAKIGVKVIDGHSHTPGIEHGHYRVGTSTALRAEYTNGPSSWLNTHCIVYSNGKRSLINIIDGDWRRED